MSRERLLRSGVEKTTTTKGFPACREEERSSTGTRWRTLIGQWDASHWYTFVAAPLFWHKFATINLLLFSISPLAAAFLGPQHWWRCGVHSHMSTTPPGSRSSSPVSPPFIDTPVHRCSRRLLGLAPEYSSLPRCVPTRQARETQTMEQPSTSQVTFQQHRVPSCFHGNVFEDVEDWLDQYERVSSFNLWNSDQKLRNVYFSLEDGARTWFENREASLQSWDDFRQQLRDTFASTDRKDHALRLLESRVQKPNESVAMFAEDMARLFRRADPDMSEPKKLRYLMHGLKEQLFAGLVRNPPRTVQEFIKEATAIERALRDRCRQYNRSDSTASTQAAVLTAANDSSLRDLVRSIVQEELGKLSGSCTQPAVASIAQVVREEIRQAIAPPEPREEVLEMSYANALARQVPCRPSPPTHRKLPPETRSLPNPGFQPRVRKTELWRTADHRPLCYHCGEAGHVYRRCPYREMGLPGFSPAARRPRFGERPPEIDAYLATREEQSARLRSRSPSPGRMNNPLNRRSSPDTPRGRSLSPRRGN